MTFDDGRIMTWRLPRFSALDMFLRQSASTEILTTARSGVGGRETSATATARGRSAEPWVNS
jgi:hypothetical protein